MPKGVNRLSTPSTESRAGGTSLMKTVLKAFLVSLFNFGLNLTVQRLSLSFAASSAF